MTGARSGRRWRIDLPDLPIIARDGGAGVDALDDALDDATAVLRRKLEA